MHYAGAGDADGGGAPFAVTLGSATAATFNFAIQGKAGTLTNTTPTETLTVTGGGDRLYLDGHR